MNIGSFFSEGYHSIMRAIGAEPAVATKPQPAQPAAAEKPAEAASLKTGESSKIESKKGTAQVSLGDSPKEMMDSWVKNRSTGHKIDLTPVAEYSKNAAHTKGKFNIMYLRDVYSNSVEKSGKPRFNEAQKQNIRNFLKEVETNADRVNDPGMRSQLMQKMDQAICTKGITDEQMQMIADGKFDADAYIYMVNATGEPIG